MLIEQRTYKLKPGTSGEFLRLYEAEGLALQREALGNLLGYFVTDVGELNRIVQLWGFESFEDRLARRAQLWSNADWRAFASKTVALIVSQRSELLTPAPFSPIK